MPTAKQKADPEEQARTAFAALYEKTKKEMGKLRTKAEQSSDRDGEHAKLDTLLQELFLIDWELRLADLNTAAAGFAELSTEAAKLADKVAKDVNTWKTVKSTVEGINAVLGLFGRFISAFRI